MFRSVSFNLPDRFLLLFFLLYLLLFFVHFLLRFLVTPLLDQRLGRLGLLRFRCLLVLLLLLLFLLLLFLLLSLLLLLLRLRRELSGLLLLGESERLSFFHWSRFRI